MENMHTDVGMERVIEMVKCERNFSLIFLLHRKKWLQL